MGCARVESMDLFSFFQQLTGQRPEVDHITPVSKQGGARNVVVVKQRKIETEPIQQGEGNLNDVAFLKKAPRE